jgi:GTP-binding protein
MSKPVVVIVGRPNVGKSTLFNRMTRSHRAIIEDIPGVTRDSNYLDAEWEGKGFVAVDTGGFYPEPAEDMFLQMKEQALFAIDEADVIIHLLDGKEGLNPLDMEIVRMLRASGKEVLWVVNKIDGPRSEEKIHDFHAIGADELWPVSAATGYGYEDFMERLSCLLPEHEIIQTDYPKIAVVGRPNVGKSTLVNALLGKKRMIVSSVPGTTRDSIDSVCSHYGKKYLIIDTAGMRKRGKIGYSIERFAMVRAVRSIEQSDIALIVMNAADGIVEQDLRIAGIVREYGKGSLFLMNKWDLIHEPEAAYKKMEGELYRSMWFMQYAPFLTVSALEKKRVTKIFSIVDEIMRERKRQIPTAELNRFLADVVSDSAVPLYRGKRVNLSYITQIRTEPPVFLIFTNYPQAIKETFIKFIEKGLRKRFSFAGTPVRIFIRNKHASERV